MKLYVVGFMFTEDEKQVVLIEKKRPEWQAGKLNGVGGKIGINSHYRSSLAFRNDPYEARVLLSIDGSSRDAFQFTYPAMMSPWHSSGKHQHPRIWPVKKFTACSLNFFCSGAYQ